MTDESIFDWARQFTMSAEDDDIWRQLDHGEYYGLNGEHITMAEWAVLMEVKRNARGIDENGVSSPDDDPTRIGSTKVGHAWVSTVWLGLDHSFGRGPPLIFETMIFGGSHDQQMWRYASREAALEGHNRIVICLENDWELP
jgi:hypothetical protein